MSFENLNLDAQIVKALTSCGYDKPTPIQERSIPVIMEGKDLVASAQTGTGKTAAFVLPALHRMTLSTEKNNKPRILILTPTRELASQITLAAGKYGKFLRFKIISLVGGMPYRQQLRELSQTVDIVVATPGRLLDHMDNGRLDLSGIEMLILDEADRMLDMGFIDDVKAISEATPKERQTLLFSATVDDRLGSVVRQLLKSPVRIDMGNSENLAPKLIEQKAYIVDNNQHKERVLMHLLSNENMYKAIIFSGTKLNADYLTRRLQDQGFEAAALHGDLKQNVRNRTVEQLRRGKIQYLVATDVAARGIDINDVTHVINYDLPKFSEDYVHRIGRTGRAGKTGIAISLVLPLDGRHLQKIERYTKQKLEFSTIDGLEPTKRINNNPTGKAAGGNGGKRFGGGAGGGGKSFGKGSFSKGGYGKKDGFREGGSEARSGFAMRKGSGSGEGFARKSYARTEESRDGYAPRKSFARTEDSRDGGAPRKSFGRKEESRDGFAPRKSFARSEDSRDSGAPRKSFARSEDSRDGGAPRKSFARSDDSRDGGAPRRSFAKKDDGFAPRKSYARSEDSRDGGAPRKSFAKKDDGFAPRKSYARSEDSRDGFAKRSDVKNDYSPRKSSFANRDGDKRSEYTPRPRSEFKSDAAPRRSFRSDDSKVTLERRDADPRVQYVRKSPKSDAPSKGRFAGKKDGARSESPGRRGRSNDTRGSFAKNDDAKSFPKGRRDSKKTFSKEK